MLSNQVAWASGTHGTYLRTTDGGTSWHTAQVPDAEALDFRDVEAFSADLAYLLSAGPGEQSRIYKTTDAGKNLDFAIHQQEIPKDFSIAWPSGTVITALRSAILSPTIPANSNLN